FSSGFSKRLRDHHCLVDDRYVKAEVDLIVALNLFLKEHRQYNLKIYLHPIEKKNETEFNFCKNECSTFLIDCKDQVSFGAISENTINTFLTIDTAISTSSTLNFERLFCGYKTLFAPIGMDPSPFEGTVIKNICINRELDFNSKLLESLQLSEEEFISKNQLEGFYYSGVNLDNGTKTK
ncbi:MAG: hypothetical protein IPI93_00005, partial [Sphingobacteriaceae bacterium]|nr:hypothetical protein [Sphingobacteriaceae bacterium]